MPLNLMPVGNRMIARILAVNDTCPDQGHMKAMKAIVTSSVRAGMAEVQNAVTDHKASQDGGCGGGGDSAKG